MDSSIEPFFSGYHVAIIGLGLMGGSLAIALHGHCASVLGMDVNPEALALARKMDLADVLTDRLEEILPKAEIIILATPVKTILSLLAVLPEYCPQGSIVLDVGSTKTDIVAAMRNLPEQFDPLGGHPMCGKERLSLENSDPAIFRGAPFAFIQLEQTKDCALQFAEELSRLLGSHAIWLDAQTHDRWTASSSHLPYLIASALTLATPSEASPLIGSGFIGTTRVASTPSSMMLDVLRTNRENVLTALSQFKTCLFDLETLLIQMDYDTLETKLSDSSTKRSSLLLDGKGRI